MLWLLLCLGSASAFWPPEWNVSLHHEEVLEVVDVHLEEGFGGEGDEMVHAEDVRALGLQLDDARMRPLHEIMAHDTHEWAQLRPLPLDVAAVSAQEEGALAREAVREAVSDQRYTREFPFAAPPPIVPRSAAANTGAIDVTTLASTTVSTEETTEEYDFERLRSEATARDEEILRQAGLLRTTAAPPARPLTWRKWFLRELFGWGSYSEMECAKISDWHLGPRGARCYFWDLVDILTGPSPDPFSHRLKIARKSARRLMRPVALMLGLYLLVALPLWCSRGWCCCCFYCCCHFCRPDSSLEEVKVYSARNPPGVWLDLKDDNRAVYTPTPEEKEAYVYLQGKLRDVLLYG